MVGERLSSREQVFQMIRLLDAESEMVRKSVREELATVPDLLEEMIEKKELDVSAESLFEIHEILAEHRRQGLRSTWLDWLSLRNQYMQLEWAVGFLSETHASTTELTTPIPRLLDQLTRDFLVSGATTDALSLNEYLFVSGRFKGAVDDYYHPQHSNIAFVLTEHQGLPISLAVVMMLVGYRLGLDIAGCALPGHFLVRIFDKQEPVLIDCFQGGKILDPGEVRALSLSPSLNLMELLRTPPTAAQMISRILINMINAYWRTGNLKLHGLAQDLLADLCERLREEELGIHHASGLFGPGDLVQHKNYGYRGVVVAADSEFTGTDSWYHKNKTQPDKEQPWYHVLVDGSSAATYAAQSNLLAAKSHQKVEHPLVPLYFRSFTKGHYLRNDIPYGELF